MRGLSRGWVPLAGVLLLCACKPQHRVERTDHIDHADKTAAVPDAHGDAGAVAAAEQAIRTDLPAVKDAQFRGVQVYGQGLPDHWAVCGQVSPYADDQALFVPFVAVVTRSGGGWASAADARFIGSSVSEADRTYLALVAHCYANGGPADTPMPSVMPIPPLPNQVPQPSGPMSPATPGAVASAPNAAGVSGSGSVTLRQNANLHATPQGASVRVVPQGTALHVFGTAPGGWLQVGDQAPWGWVHESMVVGAGR